MVLIKRMTFCIFFCLSLMHLLSAQEEINSSQNDAINVYLDRFHRDDDYVKREIQFVNYVRDPKLAQLYILHTSQSTGGGGRRATITFIGQQEFSGMNDTLTYTTKQFDPDEVRRQEMVRVLKIGLIQYVAKTPQADNILISYHAPENEPTIEEIRDKWDHWVFNISPDFEFGGEESYKNLSINYRFSARRVTENWKFDFDYDNEYEERKDITPEETYRNIIREQNFNGLFVKSITDHWSAGINTEIESSTKINTSLAVTGAPALEYNVFPYSESTRRYIRFLFGIWGKNVKYMEETIFQKKSENLTGATLMISQNIYERWGNFWQSLEGTVYFHDTEVNKLEWKGRINYRLYEGLSLQLGGELALLHDQLYLPKEESTPEEILLRVHQLKTDWTYELSFGFNYRFGSQYDNIVNPRFDRGGRFR